MDLELSFQELDEASWREAYLDYVQNNPQELQRFSA